jgi:hypothetical protein
MHEIIIKANAGTAIHILPDMAIETTAMKNDGKKNNEIMEKAPAERNTAIADSSASMVTSEP